MHPGKKLLLLIHFLYTSTVYIAHHNLYMCARWCIIFRILSKMHFIFVSDKFGTVVNFNLIYIHRIYFFFLFLLLFCPCHYFLFSFYFSRLFFFFILFLFCKLVTYREEIFLSQYIFNYFSSYFFFIPFGFCWLFLLAMFWFNIRTVIILNFFSCVFTFLVFFGFLYNYMCLRKVYIIYVQVTNYK